MRVLAFILSIFIFAMAVMPCADDSCLDVFGNDLITNFEDQSHNHAEDKEDSCTIFCFCQCCGAQITIPSFFITIEMKNTSLYTYSHHYSSVYSFDFTKGVWHPPTLS